MQEETKKFDINLNYQLSAKDEAERKGKTTPAEMTEDYLVYSVNGAYPQGMEGQLRRIWGRIQRKLFAAIESKNYVIELEAKEVDLLKKSLASAKFPAIFSKYVTILEDAINSL